jgi:hypothetical protein
LHKHFKVQKNGIRSKYLRANEDSEVSIPDFKFVGKEEMRDTGELEDRVLFCAKDFVASEVLEVKEVMPSGEL